MTRSLALALVPILPLLVGSIEAAVRPQSSFGATHSLLPPRTNAMRQAASCPRTPGGTGILVDGDFSQAPDPGSWQGIGVGTQFAPNWFVIERTIDFYGSHVSWSEPNGVCSVDLDGSGVQGVGAIAHSPTRTVAGAMYTMTFIFSGNRHCARYQHGPRVKKLLVEAQSRHGLVGQAFYWDTKKDHDAENGNFVTEAWTFQAPSNRTTFIFQSLDKPTTSNCGPVVAAISLIPTPAVRASTVTGRAALRARMQRS